nr:MAG TPA: hypothetical protein [Caudoviricetes sp.]
MKTSWRVLDVVYLYAAYFYNQDGTTAIPLHLYQNLYGDWYMKACVRIHGRTRKDYMHRPTAWIYWPDIDAGS